MNKPNSKLTSSRSYLQINKKENVKCLNPNEKKIITTPTSSIFGSLRKGVVTSTPKTSTHTRGVRKEGQTQVKSKNVNREVAVTKSWLAKTSPFSNTINYNNNNISSKNKNLKNNQIKSNGPSTVLTTRSSVPKKAVIKAVTTVSAKPKSLVTFRRGQNVAKDGHVQGQQDNVSRSSSVTNLESLDSQGHHQTKGQHTKGAKPRKSVSKERIDARAAERDRKHDVKKVTKNNNHFDQEGNTYGPDSLHEEELVLLRRQLQEMANEKSNLALQLGEQKGQLNMLQKEIQKLKAFQDDSNLELEKLTEENTALRNRLRDVAHSPLSDNEKQQLLFESHRHHGSAPASIAANIVEENGGETTCTTPDWDKHSSSNVSEISVACLQDKINQMQETHYSTNEELQATLQELTDLQRQLTELQHENERLNDEKALMFDSLCRQTERLNDSRQEVDNLKQLLYRGEKDEAAGQYETLVEREQKLVDLLKSAQEERESMLVKLEQMGAELKEARQDNLEKGQHILQLTERVRTLECTLDAKHAEHKQLDQELAIAKDQCSGKQIEINRLTDLLENARTKIIELEQDRTLSDKSELDEMLDNARREKDQLESEVAHLRDQLARSRNEAEKLKEQVSILQEECKVTRNNAKSTHADLEYKLEKLLHEKSALADQLQHFQEAVNELQVQSQCQQEDKRQLSSVLSETQRNLSDAERRYLNMEHELDELKKLRAEENEEWEKFQNDLLTSVRVANDFKTEAQQELQKIILENKTYRERVRLLEAQVEKLNKATTEPVPMRPTSFPGDDIALRRKNVLLTRHNSRQSVKSLIESIESQGKPIPKSAMSSVSRSSSTSSLNSLASDNNKTPSSPSILPTPSPGSPLRTPSDWSEISNGGQVVKTPLKEQQPNKINNTTREWGKGVITDSLSKQPDLTKSKSTDDHPIITKTIDFNRRNSYSDLTTDQQKKDPLNGLVKNGGSKRNALLKWCQNKTVGYRNIDITNFSSSWNDGLALCALLHTYLPDRIPYDSLTPQEKRRNFSLAFAAAESVGIPTTLNINDMIQLERPDWQQVMSYVTAIYRHFET